MTAIDPTARVAPGARIGDGVEIGPYCVVGPRCRDRRRLPARRPCPRHRRTPRSARHRRSIRSPRSARRRNRCIIAAGRPGSSSARDCEIRESVTMNTGTEDGGGITGSATTASSWRHRMSAHDCKVGNDVTCQQRRARRPCRASATTSFSAGSAAVHQFVRIGEGAMIGGLSGMRGRHHPVRFCAWASSRSARRAQCGRPAAARLRASAKSIACARPIKHAVSRRGRVRATGSTRVAAEFAGDAAGREASSPSSAQRQAAADASAALATAGDGDSRLDTSAPMPDDRGDADDGAARDHLRRRQLSAARSPRRSRGAAGGRRAVRACAAGPIPRRSRAIRITGSRSASSGGFCRLARAEGCRDVVFIGTLLRPRCAQIRLDWQTLRR